MIPVRFSSLTNSWYPVQSWWFQPNSLPCRISHSYSLLWFLSGRIHQLPGINGHPFFQLFIPDDQRTDRDNIIFDQNFQCTPAFFAIHFWIALCTFLQKCSTDRAVYMPFNITWSHRLPPLSNNIWSFIYYSTDPREIKIRLMSIMVVHSVSAKAARAITISIFRLALTICCFHFRFLSAPTRRRFCGNFHKNN